MQTERMLLRSSFFLFLLALITGLAIPAFHNPRAGLSAHITGLLNSFALTALAVAWPHLHSSPARKKVLKAMFLACAYTIWFSNVLTAVWGTNWLTPIAGRGFHAPYGEQVIVAVIILVTAWTYLVAAAIVVWDLRPKIVG